MSKREVEEKLYKTFRYVYTVPLEELYRSTAPVGKIY